MLKPTSISELTEYLKKHPLIHKVGDPSSCPIMPARVVNGVLWFIATAEHCTLHDVTFDEKGFTMPNVWGDALRFNYVDESRS